MNHTLKWLSCIAFVSCLTPACGGDDDPAGTGGAGGSASGSGGGGTGGSSGSASGGSAAGGSAAGGTGATGGSGGSGAMAGSGGSASGGQPGKPFVPDNITVEYAGAGPTGGLELIAFTLASNGTGGAVFYVAVKNNGTDVICGVDVPADFFDGSGTELASTIGAGALAAPMYNSFGSPSACLGPGDIGMGTASLGLSGLDVSQVAKIEHGFVGNISSSAVKLTGVTVDNVMLEVAFANNYKATGTVTNNSGMVISNPEVTIFAVDSVGRPFGEMSALDLNPISNGGTWMFNSTDTEGPVSDYVAYVSYD